MAQEFSFSEDLRLVLWKETLWHNGLRAVAAGGVWSLVIALSGSPVNPLRMMVSMPIAYFFFLLPVGLVAMWLSSLTVPFVGLISVLCALTVAPGDPLVYTLSKFMPEWVPVDRPDIFSLQIIIFVMSPFDQ